MNCISLSVRLPIKRTEHGEKHIYKPIFRVGFAKAFAVSSLRQKLTSIAKNNMVLKGSCMVGFVVLVTIQLASKLDGKAIPEHLSTVSGFTVKSADPWNMRASKAWALLHSSPCKRLQYGDNCTELKSRKRNRMNIYTADKEVNGKTLTTVLVEKVKGSFKNSDAVMVIDPYPDAHFGHTIIVFLIEFVENPRHCGRKGVFFLTGNGNGECITIAQTRSCRNRIGHGRKGRRRCEINFIPLVHTDGDINITQRLTCRSMFQGFAACPELAGRTLRRDNDKCSNSGRCSSQNRESFVNPFLRFLSICERCDYGILISGGWNVHMNQKRHLENMKDMREYLKSKGFLQRKMKVFYANNRSIDLDKDKETEDTVPATEAGGILSHIGDICSIAPECIDSFVIYLNGPTLMNGNMLLWDRNRDGIADGTEILKVRQLLEALEDCNASWITIIADQNYAGHLVDRIRDLRARQTHKVLEKLSVYTSSTKRSYTWGRDFTKKWIQRDNIWLQRNQTGVARKSREVYKEVKGRLPIKFSTRELSPLVGRNRAINGNFGDEPGCRITKASHRSTYRRPSFFELSRKWMRRPRGASDEKTNQKGESVKPT